MKIGLVFIGAIREQLPVIRENIIALKESFKEHELSVILSTWFPLTEEYIIHGNEYAYDYDFNEFLNSCKDLVDEFIILKQDTSKYLMLNNRWFPDHPPIYMYHMIEVSKYLKEKNFEFDHIVKSRHDNLFKIKNSNNYLNDKLTVPFIYHVPGAEAEGHSINDHAVIMPYEKFLKLSEIGYDEMKHYCSISGSGENLCKNVFDDIGEIEFIDREDILAYRNKGIRHFV